FNPRVESCEVSFAQQATRLLAEIADTLCDGPTINVVPDSFEGGHTSLPGVLPLDLRQTLEGSRKIGLDEEFTCLRQMAARHINSHCAGPLLPYRLSASHGPRQIIIKRTPLGEFNGRLDDFAEAHGPVFLQRQEDGIHGAGNEGAEWAERGNNPAASVTDGAEGDQPGVVTAKVFVELHRGKFRRDSISVDGHHRTILQLDEDRALATRAKAGHLHYGSGEERGDTCVHSVPASFQDSQACLGDQRMACRHYAALARHQGLKRRRRTDGPKQVHSSHENECADLRESSWTNHRWSSSSDLDMPLKKSVAIVSKKHSTVKPVSLSCGRG